MTALAWQRRRGSLNHDWLKNRFIPALGKLLNIFDGHVTDDGFAYSFLEHRLGEWSQLREQFEKLLNDCPYEMSPARTLESRVAGLRLKELGWLTCWVQCHWLRATHVDERLRDARARMEELEHAMGDAVAAVSAFGVARILEDPAAGRPMFAALHDACAALARAISALPTDRRPL